MDNDGQPAVTDKIGTQTDIMPFPVEVVIVNPWPRVRPASVVENYAFAIRITTILI